MNGPAAGPGPLHCPWYVLLPYCCLGLVGSFGWNLSWAGGNRHKTISVLRYLCCFGVPGRSYRTNFVRAPGTKEREIDTCRHPHLEQTIQSHLTRPPHVSLVTEPEIQQISFRWQTLPHTAMRGSTNPTPKTAGMHIRDVVIS